MRNDQFVRMTLVCITAAIWGGCSPVGAPDADVSSSQVLQKVSLQSAAQETTPKFLENYFQYDSFTLDNGLRVIIHEDRAAPAVSVASFFYVGSANEPIGKTGFAHLFEHLLFNGTVNAPGEFFTYLDEIGGTGTNGTTSYDRTNYYETVPTGALERILWLESDRMINFLDGLTEKSLRTQIDVVKNEKGLSDNRPFGTATYDQLKYIYPANHPYSRSVIGSIEDLENASLEDARKWFRDYYGARNTVLVLSGDINRVEAEPLVRKYFAHMKAGPGISRPTALPLKRTQNTIQTITDVAPQSGLERAYVLPPVVNKESYFPALALIIFGSGQESRLYKHMVEDKKLASSTAVYPVGGVLANTYVISITPADGVSLDEISSELDSMMESYRKTGPREDEIARHRGFLKSNFYSATESIDLKAAILAEGLLYHDDPHFELNYPDWLKAATPQILKMSAQDWLTVGYHETRKQALSEAKVSAKGPDYSKMPAVKKTPVKDLPKPERFTLNNGLEVAYVYRPNSPRIVLDYTVPVGKAHYAGDEARYTLLTNLFVSEGGAGGMNRTEISEARALAGALILSTISRNFSSLALATNVETFDSAFDLWAKSLLQPNFSEDDFKYFRDQYVEFIKADKKTPSRIAGEVAALTVYGDDSYDTMDEKLEFWETAEYEKSRKFYEENYRPDGATLYVIGDIQQSELERILNAKLAKWDGKVQPREIVKRTTVQAPKRPRFILVNDEQSSQTRVTALRLSSFEQNPKKDYYLEELTNRVWGGGFTSRLNLNLREDKGWTYGISSLVIPGIDIDSSWAINGSVTGKNTVDVVKEINREISDYLGPRPVTQAELKKTVDPMVKGFSNNMGNILSFASTYGRNDLLGKPHSYLNAYRDRLQAVTVEDIKRLAPTLMQSNDITWVLVGDLNSFEDNLRAANLGDIEVYDLKGERLR